MSPNVDLHVVALVWRYLWEHQKNPKAYSLYIYGSKYFSRRPPLYNLNQKLLKPRKYPCFFKFLQGGDYNVYVPYENSRTISEWQGGAHRKVRNILGRRITSGNWMCYEFIMLKDKLYEPINKEVHQIVRICMVGNWTRLFVNRRSSFLLNWSYNIQLE